MKPRKRAENGRIPSATGKSSTRRYNPEIRDSRGRTTGVSDLSSWGELPTGNWDLPEWSVEDLPFEEWEVEEINWGEIELIGLWELEPIDWEDLTGGDWSVPE